MNLEIQKKGQGKYARGAAYVLAGILALFGAFRFYASINVPGRAVFVDDVPVLGVISAYNLAAIAVALIGMLLVHLFLNRLDAVDLLIETEQEMKKVDWPGRAVVQNATLVVILVTFVLAILLHGFDVVLQWLFQLVF
jgi:preprotein translocase SecE subunit